MPLKYPGEWKFDGLGIAISRNAQNDFFKLVQKIAAGQANRKYILEHFKSAFGCNGWSTDESWAETDLEVAMQGSADNAALYIDSLWTGIENVKSLEVSVPSARNINDILREHDIPLEIEPPHLHMVSGDAMVVESLTSVAQGESRSPIYVRGRLLGTGGFGMVYRVTRETTVGEFEFAMKVLDPSPFNEAVELSLARFRREIAVLKKLQHRGIVQFFDAGIDQEQKPYILMPIIDGLNLFKGTEGKALPYILDLFVEIVKALTYAHSLNVLHRDLKPSNILVRASDDQPIIVDFGCAYLLDNADETSLTNQLLGSIGYIPSEVQNDPKLRSPKHDVYACGVMLYEVIARYRPDRDDYKPLSTIRGECDRVDQLVKDALAPAHKRIDSPATFLNRLQELRRSL